MNGPWSLISGAGADATPADDDTKASVSYSPAADIVDKYLPGDCHLHRRAWR